MNPLLQVATVLAALAVPSLAQAPEGGLTLFNPNFDTNARLVDANGQVVHTWAMAQNPGNTLYLEDDGTLLRAKQVPGPISIGGFGGGVERIAFDGTVTWDFLVSNSQYVQHHEVLPMPNGNVLMIVWERLTAAEAIAAGRNPALQSASKFLPDALIEYQQTGPTTGAEVWRWRAMDHLVQDFDPTKPNFGVVANSPERIDLNFPATATGSGEWMHSNSISYDAALDQVLLSVPFLNEIWILDHSTTTAEAAGSTGGNSGKGGDLLYRWGNPAAYGAGTAADQQLFNQHGGMFIEPGRPGAGNILLFNNQVQGPPVHSEVWELERQADALGSYPLAVGSAFGPLAPVWSYVAPNPADLSSAILSSAQRMPNGNTLVCSGTQGWFFEVTTTGTKVWEYFNTEPVGALPYVFKIRRYAHYLWSDANELSAGAGGTVGFDLVVGTDHAGELYLLLGSFGGTSPGLVLDGQLLPLVIGDPYFLLTLTQPNQPPFAQTFGALDALGRASASLSLPPGLAAPLVGLSAHHAFVTIDPVTVAVTLASNAQVLTVVP